MSKIVENYLIQEKVGAGQFGNVHLAKHLKTKEKVAIKVVNKRTFQKQPILEKFTRNEIASLKKINNKNIVRFIEIMRSTNNTYYVYEFCNGGNLEELLKKEKKFSEK